MYSDFFLTKQCIEIHINQSQQNAKNTKYKHNMVDSKKYAVKLQD